MYAAFAAGDIPGVLALLADDVVWNEAEGNKLADRSPYVGPQAVLEGVFERLAQDFAEFSVEIDMILDEGDLVVTQGRYHAKARGSEVEIHPRIASFWTVRNGKIAAFQQHVDTLILSKAIGEPDLSGAVIQPQV
ncbi:Ketosteroid isomerase-like protein [Erythrobacter dokdonensis DSW-74]|uniref:Ketosteroid isomerase-like protein n=2 Tax=Erythrobacter TaxID=1041 RepID=A0A1A7BDB2_9SPHN|nr:Ketosteroid isomerase-like protein [Erythrobacter dokdonensis DSW-74]